VQVDLVGLGKGPPRRPVVAFVRVQLRWSAEIGETEAFLSEDPLARGQNLFAP
jgi:hypothetical protein